MIRLIKIPISLLALYLISSFGAWLYFIKDGYFLEPSLIIAVWVQLFPQIPYPIILSSFAGVIIFTYINFGENKFFNQKKQKYGYAKFASRANLKNFGLEFETGIILGKAFGKFIKLNKSLSVLVLAPPGTGKTAGVVIPTLLTLENSVLVHDPKGELYDLTAETRKGLSKVFLFDPLVKDSAKFNPFAKEILPKEADDLRGYILNLANLLFKPPREGDKYFVDAAKSAFLFFAEWLIWKKGFTSLPEIREKLLEDADIATTIRVMIATTDLPRAIMQDGNGVLISEDSEKQWAGVVGTLKEGLEIFADPRIKKVISSECEFTGETLRKESCSVYLKVRDKDSKRLEPLISMLFEAIGTQLISQIPKKEEQKVTFILDEFVRLGRMELIRDLPAISRGYSVNSLFVAQDYEQIAVKYGREAVAIFESNCAYKVIFQQNNFYTADKISKTIGNKTTKRKSFNKSASHKGLEANENIGRSISEAEEGLALVTAQDILNMPEGKCLILAQGNLSRPIKANAALYFKDSGLKKLLVKNEVNYD